MFIDDEDFLAHYGILRKSGRYPWGSGSDDNSASRRDFISQISELKKSGMSETEVAASFGMSTTQLRALNSIAKNAEKAADIARAERLREKGYSPTEIGRLMGKSESSVRALLQPGAKERAQLLETTSDMLRGHVDAKTYIDIGAGVERQIGISRERLSKAVEVLKAEGYRVHTIQEDIVTAKGNKKVYIKVLAPPGTTYGDVAKNRGKIQQIQSFINEDGKSFLSIHEPLQLSSKRVKVVYGEEGAKADGLIEVRRNVEDVSIGKTTYAQVRVAVDGTHYIKGMAVYRDDMPKGYDLVVYTPKEKTGNKLDAFKPIKDDPDNPFGSTVRQIVTRDKDGNERVTSAMNIVRDEGQYDSWSKNLASQFLAKQPIPLAKAQLAKARDRKQKEFDEIMSLTNPMVKRKLLQQFSDSADSAAVEMKAAPFARQSTHVLMPIPSMKSTEVYSPNFNNGEKVALVRYPHGGIFEIPVLTVNNNNRDAKRVLGRAKDAIGINHKVAERLSGADFDGDTVIAFPVTARSKIKTSPPLEGLKNFHPKEQYKGYEGMTRMTTKGTAMHMGLVSNLITDMTVKGATESEITRAVRHAMVVIDAEKHNLNYKQSAIDNGIPALMSKYQNSKRGGASTLLSKATGEVHINERKPRPMSEGGPIDKRTGKLVFKETGDFYTRRVVNKRTGEVTERKIYKKTTLPRMATVDDAHKLSYGRPMEKVYADHANSLKSLANTARKEMVSIRPPSRSESAARVYAKEVVSLNAKLNEALMNAPRERQAQVLANSIVRAKLEANKDLDAKTKSKLEAKAIASARARVGASKPIISVTDREWQAIQANAISPTALSKILDNADMTRIKQLATPKPTLLMNSAKLSRARTLLANGATQAEVAEAIGVSLTTLKRSLSS